MLKRKNIIIILLSILYSSFITIGTSFLISNSFELLEKKPYITLLVYILLVILIFNIIKLIFDKLENRDHKLIKFKKIKKSKIYKLFDKYPFRFSMIFMIICWLPYIISFYPVIMSPDPSYQIKQFFQIPNKYSNYSIMIDPNVTITNHHPVIHTLLLGTCTKIGVMINNVNLGLFIYSMIQIVILSSALSYTIKFLKENNIKNEYLILILLVYSLIPIFPFYSMSAVKDVIFTSLIIIYIIALYKLIKKNDIETKSIFKIIVLLILIILFRNNGIHTVILSFPLLLLIKNKKAYRLKLLSILLVVLIFNFSYNKIILPYFKITPTSIRETLSIPFQQTGRYVKYHSKEVTEEEKKSIDRVLEYDSLAKRYKPDISDPVKNKFNKYASKEDIKNYFITWFNQFKKHPKTYLEATIDNTYGYYYPLKMNWFIYHKFDDRITKDGFDYHYNKLNKSRDFLTRIGVVYPYLPILNVFVNIGFNVWIIIFMTFFLIYKKKYRELIFLSPSIVLILVCIASPVNSYFRYAMPYVFSLMLNLALFIKEANSND